MKAEGRDKLSQLDSVCSAVSPRLQFISQSLRGVNFVSSLYITKGATIYALNAFPLFLVSWLARKVQVSLELTLTATHSQA